MAPKKTIAVDALKHKDKRANIPTEELRGFLPDEAQQPQPVIFPGLLYARDPSLDPQLVWQGKDEQDQQPLTVPAVPIYIQEKIHPQVIIENLRTESKKSQPDEQLSLFADFNGIKFEDLIEFYQHESNWANRMILGDSLMVMTSLAEKERLKGKVQMIYIDPPYGIKFNSNWQVSTRKRDVKDGKAEDLTRQPEQVRAFRDTWALGIHSYLSYLRDRLIVARELLTDSGSVFVQMGEENVHLVRSLLDEVFGSENFVSQIVYRTKNMTFGAKYLETIGDFILFYAKNKETVKYRQIYREMQTEGDSHWNLIEYENCHREQMTAEQIAHHSMLPKGVADLCQLGSLYPAGVNASGLFSFLFRGVKYSPPPGKSWKTNQDGLRRAILANRLEPYKGGQTVRYVMKVKDYPISTVPSMWHDTAPPSDKSYVVQTSDTVIERCLLMVTDPGDLVLDPTCGSGTTAYVAEQWGRRWITIDTSRVALALARTRLMAGRFPYYILADSPEGLRKEAEAAGKVPPEYKTSGDIKKGFVCKRVPHITLKAIANNEEIDEIHAKYQPELERLRKELNKALKQQWEEWEIPRELPTEHAEHTEGSKGSGAAAKKAVCVSACSACSAGKLLQQFWELKRTRQAEIDASITRNADQETLVDQPYEDNKRIRVTGPFTFETLSPHRSISVAEKKRHKEVGIEGFSVDVRGPNDFGFIVIENLKKAGVQNTIKNERMKFDRLEPYAGTWIHAEGEYTDKDDKVRRVGVCIGPEHGTVGPELIHEAAKEAVKGRGFDVLIVCGFAFDPHAPEEAKRYGALTVLPTRMNADLAMGDELLKKTGAGNLFMVFGEPDIVVRSVGPRNTRNTRKGGAQQAAESELIGGPSAAGDMIEVEIRGLDIYDPTTGEIRSNSTDDIACWFIDTDYNEESFFVRHAYFTGGDEPYDKLKRALRAEINEEAWQTLYSTTSRPFPAPKNGKIAIKVINHFGDEVLKVFAV